MAHLVRTGLPVTDAPYPSGTVKPRQGLKTSTRQDHGGVADKAVAARSKYLHWLWQTESHAVHAKCSAGLRRRAGTFEQTFCCTSRAVAAVQKDHSSPEPSVAGPWPRPTANALARGPAYGAC